MKVQTINEYTVKAGLDDVQDIKVDVYMNDQKELEPTATSSDGRLIEALECAKYAIENPDSNQAFAIMAIDHALNTATSSDVMISREKVEHGWLTLGETTPISVKQAIVDRINGEEEHESA